MGRCGDSSHPIIYKNPPNLTFWLVKQSAPIFSFKNSYYFSLLPTQIPMAALGRSSAAATTSLSSSSARFRRSLHLPPSQLSFPRARFSVNATCPFFSDNNGNKISLPQDVVASKPSPLELLKTSAADSKSSFLSLHSQILKIHFLSVSFD